MRTAAWLTGLCLVGALVAAPVHEVAAQAAPQTWTLTPPEPGSPLSATVTLTEGRLALTVARAGATVLQPSALGIRTSAADLTSGLAFVSRSERRVQEQYATATGRRRQHEADASETTLRFAKGGENLDLVFRVSADGLGYRYVLPRTGTITVTGEASEFAVPTASRAVLLKWDNGRSDYESIHTHTTVGSAAAIAYGYPSLFQVGSTWLLVTESDMSGSYGATRITLANSDRKFRVTLPDSGGVVSQGPLATPWRTMIVGDLATVVESDLTTDLARPSKVADQSWIRPGASAWSWWGDGTGDLVLQKRYVDYAAKQGWEYILVDSGWVNWSAGQVQELIGYGKQRGVGIQLWVRYSDLDTDAERNQKLPLWRSWGVAGLKIDFMDSDSQARMRWYDAILAATAEHRLLVNFHGATVPRGLERTWPHVMTMEAVRGAEGIKPKPGKKPFPIAHYLTLPFTRNLAGSMDFTPVTFSAVRDNSDAAELALSVVFESGIQNFADKPTSYAKYPIAERLLRAVPTAWDQTELLSGDPGKQAVFARRSGAQWYVGAIFGGNARTVQTPLDFLGAGEWLAEIYSDTAEGKLAFSAKRVTAGSTLSQSIAKNGGFSMRLCQAPTGATACP